MRHLVGAARPAQRQQAAEALRQSVRVVLERLGDDRREARERLVEQQHLRRDPSAMPMSTRRCPP